MVNVSVIIVNYNSAHLVEKCVESIYKFSTDITFEIIIADNDAEKSRLQKLPIKYADLIVLTMPYNLGFATACNAAEDHANGQYLFFLNPDTVLKNNSLKFFFEFWETKKTGKKIACIGTDLRNENAEIIHSFGEFPLPLKLITKKLYSLTNHFFVRRKVNKILTKKQDIGSVDYVSGAALFISKENFEKVGKFDPKFFMYFEETDLQYRLSKIQLQAYVIPGPVIVHLQGASFGNNSALKRVYYFNSLLYFIQKHNSFLVAKIFAFLWIVFDFKTFIQKIIVGFKKNES